MLYYLRSNELRHYGIKGQKHGVRRYQNEDGTLTPAGKERYSRDLKRQGIDENSKRFKNNPPVANPDKWVSEDMSNTKKVVDSVNSGLTKAQSANSNAMRNSPKIKMDLSKKTDKEMRDEINRALLERQYNDLFAPRNTRKGREYLDTTLKVAGAALTATSTALTIALAIRDLKGKGV